MIGIKNYAKRTKKIIFLFISYNSESRTMLAVCFAIALKHS